MGRQRDEPHGVPGGGKRKQGPPVPWAPLCPLVPATILGSTEPPCSQCLAEKNLNSLCPQKYPIRTHPASPCWRAGGAGAWLSFPAPPLLSAVCHDDGALSHTPPTGAQTKTVANLLSEDWKEKEETENMFRFPICAFPKVNKCFMERG